MTINVHSYESMGTFDGPGLRLVVFLQGCNFRCLYCANPDTIAGKGGTPTPPEEIVRMAMSQRPFFGKRGGVTFSGGEPTFQAKALVPLVRELKEKGIHVCIDSNGGIWNEEVEELFKLTDLVLLDIKHINDEEHRKLTLHSNKNILDCARYLSEIHKPVWIRHVLIPGITDKDEYLEELRDFLSTLSNIQRIDVLPYHTMGIYKYEKLGIPYPLDGIEPPGRERVAHAESILQKAL